MYTCIHVYMNIYAYNVHTYIYIYVCIREHVHCKHICSLPNTYWKQYYNIYTPIYSQH